MSEIKKPVILHLTSLATGGAGSYTMELHRGMLALGYDSYVAIRGKEVIFPNGEHIIIKKSRLFLWNKFGRLLFRLLIKYVHVDNKYSLYNLCEQLTCHSAADTLATMPDKPDIIFVHWASDYINARVISEFSNLTNAKIIINCLDQAPFTGGCHYPNECRQFERGCIDCPISSSRIVKKAISDNFKFKIKNLPEDVILMGGAAEDVYVKSSPLYCNKRFIKTYGIVDERVFCAGDKLQAKLFWNIPENKKVIMFGCSNLSEPRKGMAILIDAIKKLQREDFVLLVLGNEIPKDLAMRNCVIAGYVDYAKLIKAYQAADVFACPTLADSGPLMVNQSIMCGTPVVSFPVGISIDFVKTGKTGYLARYADADDFAHGLNYVLDVSKADYENMSQECRNVGLKMFAKTNSYSSLDMMLNRIMFEN